MTDAPQKPELHVVIDTSVWQHDLLLRSAEFGAIERLAAAGYLKLYLPMVVEGEVKGHLQELYSDALESIRKPLHDLLRKRLPIIEKDKFDLFMDLVKTALESYPAIAISEFDKRLRAMNCERVAINVVQAQETMDSYFAGRPPFRKPRSKDDIPDTLIFEAVRELSDTLMDVHVIVGDKRLRQICSTLAHVRTYSSLKEFLSAARCKALLLEEEARENVESALEILEYAQLKEFDWVDWAENTLTGSSFYDSGLPADDEEGLIVYSYEPYVIDLDLSAATYLGEGFFSIPIGLKVRAGVSYAIFKGDFHVLTDERTAGMSLSERNKHYFEAEEELDLVVEGTVLMEFDFDELRKSPIPNVDLETIIETTEMEMQLDYEVKLSDSIELH